MVFVHARTQHKKEVNRERSDGCRHAEIARASRHPQRPRGRDDDGAPTDRPRIGIAELPESRDAERPRHVLKERSREPELRQAKPDAPSPTNDPNLVLYLRGTRLLGS